MINAISDALPRDAVIRVTTKDFSQTEVQFQLRFNEGDREQGTCPVVTVLTPNLHAIVDPVTPSH